MMTCRFCRPVFVLIIALSIGRPAPAQESLARLDEDLKAVAVFEYGKDSGPLQRVEDTAVAAAKDPQQRAAVEERLLKTLASAETVAGKDFICRMLRIMGTAKSVPRLEAMLSDPETSHMARYALGYMEYPEAGAALLRALGKTSGDVQAGILYSLGNRQSKAVLPAAVKLVAGADEDVAVAAAVVLGQLGGDEAVKALQTARQGSSKRLQRTVNGALLSCAEKYVAAGRTQDAARLYDEFRKPDQPAWLRIAALRGMMTSGGTNSVKLLVANIRGDDPVLQASAIEFTQLVEGAEATRAFAGQLPYLAPESQVLLLRALGARGDSAAASGVASATKSQSEEVRVAALEALGELGDASTVEPLAKAAASSGGNEQRVARASLVRLSGDNVNAAIVRSLSGADPKVQVELIRALAGRRATPAIEVLFGFAGNENAGVRREAYAALGTLSGAPELPALVAQLVRPKDAGDRQAIEQALADAYRRIEAPDEQAAPILAALPKAPADAKPSMLQLLATPATPAALEAVRAALNYPDAGVRKAAVQTLADWPNAAPAGDLLHLTRSLDDPDQKAIALRGYVRLAGISDNPTAMYVQAMKLAERADEKRAVLSGLGSADSAEALDLVENYLGDAELGDAAAQSAVQIADLLRRKDEDRAKAALRRVLETAKKEDTRKKAADLISEMEKYQGYILTWLGTGPYREKGKEGEQIYQTVFAPEKLGAKDIEWKPIKTGIGPWSIDLERVYGQIDFCAAYVKTRVWSPADMDARLEMGSDDALKVWLNGEMVQDKYRTRGLEPRQDVVDVNLKKGWNDLMLKVVDHQGGWSFCCRLRDRNGSAIGGLKIEAE